MKSGVTPTASCSSSVNCEWVVLEGCITKLFASPMFARCDKSFTLLMNSIALSRPPLIPNPNIAP